MSKRCTYCGTERTESGHEVDSDGRYHAVTVCREYVYAALQAYKKENAALRIALDVVRRRGEP